MLGGRFCATCYMEWGLMWIKKLDGFKEVVDGCVCYATEGHDHLFSYRKHATGAYATSGVSLDKVITRMFKGS